MAIDSKLPKSVEDLEALLRAVPKDLSDIKDLSGFLWLGGLSSALQTVKHDLLEKDERRAWFATEPAVALLKALCTSFKHDNRLPLLMVCARVYQFMRARCLRTDSL